MASNAFNISPKGQPRVFSSESTPNIDANYGPWESQDEYKEYLKKSFYLGDDEVDDFILPGTIIAVYNTPESPETSGITRYIRENGAWRSLESGGSGGGNPVPGIPEKVIQNIVPLSLSDFNDLPEKDDNTLYLIIDN